jgi:uncharacterized SAM-binding protein YcdF (DUF218 family)
VYDLIIVPGGGVSIDGSVPEWVRKRLDRAAELSGGDIPVLCLSAATVHKPSPLDATGRPVLEAVAAARYLVDERGFPPSRVFLEFHSYDTIGNAYFARVCHTDLRPTWRRLLVVNSAFHMERTEAVFRWVFGLAPDHGYELGFETVPNAGMPEEDLAFRCKREADSLEKVRRLEQRIRSMAELHAFLFSEHDAYSAEGVLRPREREQRLERVY